MEQTPSITPTENKESQTPSFLYHMVPEDMKGNILYPLNTLRTIDEDLYAKEIKKYTGREEVLQRLIPTLGCLWNDVLHMSAVKPEELKQALIEAGMKPREMEFYKIDPSLLDPSKSTIYLFNNGASEMTEENFTNYDPSNLTPHATLPESTKKYYKEMFAKKEKPLFFLGVPHIFHKGPIDVSDLSKIEVIRV